MIDLPRALQPWKEELAIFPRDLALSIIPWLPRLALAVGPLRAQTSTRAGSPDGFGGLSRRGPYERLLLSEWLLALELPEEFTRRAAMGEHAFLELARREPAGSKRSTALFDAGPSQLGTPRLLHLALLIVLLRRAKDAGAAFTWGILQAPDGRTYEDLTASSVMSLLDARSAGEPSSADVEDWLDRLAAPKAPDDVWLVGSKRIATLAPAVASSKLEIHDVLERDARKLKLAVRRARSVESEVELPLPEDRACVRLLRDPFQVTAPAPSKPARTMSAISNLLFSTDGRRLFVRDTAGNIILYKPPGSPRAHPGLPRVLSAMGERVVAIGSFGKDTYLIGSDTKQLSVRGFSRRGRFRDLWKGVDIPADFPFWHPGERTPVQPCYLAPDSTAPQSGLVFLDAVGRLLHLRVTPPKTLALLEWGVTAIARAHKDLVMVVDHAGGWAPDFSKPQPHGPEGPRFVARLGPGMKAPQPIMPLFDLNTDGDLDVFFGYGGSLAHLDVGVLALRKSDRKWSVYDRTGRSFREAPEGSIVFGVSFEDRGHSCGLLVIQDDQQTVSWIGRDAKRDVLHAEAPITYAVASTARPDFAYTTGAGELHVCSLEHGPLLHVMRDANKKAGDEDDEDGTAIEIVP